MLSFLDLVAEEKRKYENDCDSNNDTDRIFLLYVINQAMMSYVIFEDFYTSMNVSNRINLITRDSIYYGDCEPSFEIKDAIDKCAFDIPLTMYPDFFLFLFDFLVVVLRKCDKSALMQPCTSGNLNFPVNYAYFQKIVVKMTPGEWSYLDEYGRKRKIISGTKIDQLKEEDIRKPTDGYYVKHKYMFNNGESSIGDKYIFKSEAIDMHSKWLARAKSDIQRQKENYQNELEGMKAQGYPYADSYEEYIRFLNTNLKNMKFGRFTIIVKDLLNLFIPCPLK